MTGFAKALALLTALLALTMDKTGLPLQWRRIALTVMNYFRRRESRVDRGDHARFEEVRVDEGGWTSIVDRRRRRGAHPERLITFWISGGDWRPFIQAQSSDGLGLA